MQIMNNIYHEKQNKRYRRKYKAIEVRIKSLLIENAALCDEVAKIQESIIIVKEERKFLLRKLLEYNNVPDSTISYIPSEYSNAPNGSKAKLKRKIYLEDGI